MNTKLTLVSVQYGFRHRAVFLQLPVGNDGKVRADMVFINRLLNEMGCRSRGETYTVG